MIPFLPWLLFGLSTYVLIGITLAYHMPIGKKYFANTQEKLVVLWIFPAIGFVIMVFVIVFCYGVIDIFMFGDKNPGLKGFFEDEGF